MREWVERALTRLDGASDIAVATGAILATVVSTGLVFAAMLFD